VAAGATVTTLSMTVRCDPADIPCARRASLGIWTGIGVAALGSLAGILVVEAGARRRARAAVALTPGGASLVGTF
jgi:hypothetical protein